MSAMSGQQKRLWKLIQSGNLTKVQDFLQSLQYDSSILLNKVHKASGDTSMHLACRHGFFIMAVTFHEKWKIDLESKNLDGKTPLHEAASNGHVNIVKFLLNNGVDVDRLKRSDWTPLMMACTKPGNLDTVKMLIGYGAVPNLVNKDGWDCFHIACRQGDMSMIKYLYSLDNRLCKGVSKNGRRPIHTAALHGLSSVLQFLVEACSLSLQVQDSCGSTPLMEATKGGHMDLVKYIVAQGVNLCMGDNLGRTVLHVAAENNQDNVINYLVTHCGIDPNSKTLPVKAGVGGKSALDWAYKEQQTKAIAILKELGACDS